MKNWTDIRTGEPIDRQLRAAIITRARRMGSQPLDGVGYAVAFSLVVMGLLGLLCVFGVAVARLLGVLP